ncbi:exodeoxyribonuclease V subunit gamma [Microvirgula aerodenitrificans]|uniref:RecBCD enzyme subunit RecC n=1 Tax=Microvirgula aerodenitrificans TaxID=57480 RepID=A0A2S0PDZ7_9NEIS|nr:exodeoxyribonuclease V subunit gamma [Microvirgula aerodenitrificans]AVY95487.1 exodeoxyribonuclease V subunit gamma [Microvirgula aerodenitrificans]
MLTLYRSNRLEVLAQILIAQFGHGDPLAPEVVLVQGRAVERWLTQRIASQCGIAAHFQFLFPARLAWQLTRPERHAAEPLSPYTPEVLSWRVFDLLERGNGAAADPLLAHYLGQGDAVFRFDLAARIADVFDQYLLYRPLWVAAWERGERCDLGPHEEWQATLWATLVADEPAPHRAESLGLALQALEAGQLPEDLPPRLSVFAPASLPPMYQRLLQAIARHRTVDFYLLDPSSQWWGDVRDYSEQLRAGITETDDADTLHLDVGHPLLASLGKQWRDFLGQILTLEPAESTPVFISNRHADEAPRPLLLELQDDLLHLTDRSRAHDNTLVVADDDRSIEFHAASSPMREVEAVYDRLLTLFDADPTLTASDVALLAADIDRYAPCIDAVFGTDRVDERPRLAYSIADRALAREHPLYATVLGLIALPGSRFEVERITDLLALPALRRRFGLSAADGDRIAHWLATAGVRWGRDAAHRERFGQPAEQQNTWAFGLTRLLLGFALPPASSAEAALYTPDDVAWLPSPGPEGADGETLGRLCELFARLAAFDDACREDRPAPQWFALLQALLDDLLQADDDEALPFERVQAAVAALQEESRAAGDRTAVPYALARTRLEARLSGTPEHSRHLAGGMTVGALVQLRGVPFRVIVLLGLNDGDFPRQPRAPGFDLIARHPRPGDRSRRHDDRSLFVETLLAARERLLISYIGQNERDLAELPPSPVVAELMDVIERGYRLASGAPLLPALCVRHALQPFSPRYFGAAPPLPPGHLAIHAELATLLHAGQAGRPAAGLFANGIVLPAVEIPALLELDTLVRFWRHPARWLLRQRLGLWLDHDSSPLDGRDPFALDFNDRQQLTRTLFAAIADGDDGHQLLDRARAGGLLPHGEYGSALLRQEQRVVDVLESRAREVAGGNTAPFDIDLPLPAGTGQTLRLSGRLGDVERHPDGRPNRTVLRPGGLFPSDLIVLWIEHLALCAGWPDTLPAPVTGVLARGKEAVDARRLRPLAAADARARLGELVDGFLQGQQSALPFFPRTALAWGEAVRGDKPGAAVAQKSWNSDGDRRGDGDNPYARAAFGERDTPPDGFEHWAGRIVLPLLDHLESWK